MTIENGFLHIFYIESYFSKIALSSERSVVQSSRSPGHCVTTQFGNALLLFISLILISCEYVFMDFRERGTLM